MAVFGALGQAGGSLTSALGNYVGMDVANDYINKAGEGYNNYANQGIDTLKQGQSAATTAYRPYTQAGETGIAGQTSATQDYLKNVGTGPQSSQYASGTQNVNDYLNPSAAYSTDQANKAIQASAIAAGGMGGGLAKALSNNANQLAMTNYNNAYNQMLQTNNQNFNQANQQYQNNYNAQNQNLANYQNLSNIGLSANNANQQLQSGYNSGINSNYMGMADTAYNKNMSKANNFQTGINNMFTNTGNSMAQGGSAFDSLYKLGK